MNATIADGVLAGMPSSFANAPGVVPTRTRVDGSTVRTRLRLTRRGRVVFTMLAGIPAAVLATVVVLGAGGAAADTDASRTSSFETVVVGSDDTLWEIAESIAPKEDPREVIAEILRINGLRDGVIHPGQQLALPAVD